MAKLTNEQIEKAFADAVMARVQQAEALGLKASWRTQHHLDVAAGLIAECVKDDVVVADIRDVIQKTYNQSAFAQKLEKAFKATGHFQRESAPKDVEGLFTQLAKEVAARGQGQQQQG